ncbi:MAG: hypothetical protein ACFFDS_07430 [Candidatus Thorarchaeota archaeon]
MTEKVKQEKPENENEWTYNYEVRKVEKKNIAFYHGHSVIY